MELPVLRGERVTLRPVAEADLDPLCAVVREPGVAKWWGESDEPERLRDNLAMDGAAFVIEVDGKLAGWLGFTEETEPEYRSVGIDISLSERFQGRGLGPDALRTVIRWFAKEHGHHRFTIDPNAANERAISAYKRVGFRPVGVMRKAELRDGEWTDGLLMDLLTDELQ
jgi:aminoglycoside 6'-N-acetyltransferase